MNKEKVVYCSMCNKKLIIRIDNKGNYIGGHYFGIVRDGISDWAVSELIDGEFKRCISYRKILYYKMRDLKRLILKQYKEFEIWECDECYNDEDG